MMGIGAKAMKFGGEAWSAAGMETYFNLTMPIDTIHTAASGYKDFINDSWNNNPNTFANAGVNMASTGSSGMMAASTLLASGMHSYNKYIGKGLQEASMFSKTGQVVAKDALQYFKPTALEALGKGTKGFLKKGGGFKRAIGGAGWVGGLGMVAALGMDVAGSYILGAAGSMIDQAYQTDKNRKKMHYDTRFFNTGYQEQSAYQTIGSAMQAYEDKMVSGARVLHSRG